MRHIDTLVIHCTATRESQDLSKADLRYMHVNERGWNDIGYHFYIRKDGKIEFCRPVSEIGAHVKGYNRGSIAIAYEGGLDNRGKAKDTRTDQQKLSIEEAIRFLVRAFPIKSIKGHRDLSPDKDGDGVVERHEWLKECPCFNAEQEYKYLIC